MPPDAEIIPMHRTVGPVQPVQAIPLRRAAGDGITWEGEHPAVWSAPRAGGGPLPTPSAGTPASLDGWSRAGADRPVGARRTVPSARVRRRRAVLLLLVAATVVTLLALPLRVLAGASPALASPARALALRSGQIYVIRPGDTLWSIAERLDPTGDPNVAVSRMERRLGTDTVYPGEQITLP